jgi:outer membrane receptor protein involved in Fe transport
MKRILLLITIFCSVLSAKAQLGGGGSSVLGKISGTIVDSVTKKPLDYATVSLFKSGGKAPLNGAVTDEKGNFSLNNIAVGNYKLVVSFIGYPSKTIDPVTTTREKPDAKLGSIVLAPSSKTLNAVVIEGQQSVIENRIDKIVFNAEKDLTSAGGNATDILRKVPLVAVDINGNVSLRGDQNVRVLINGKPSGAMSANLADVLRTIPADQIKNVEVITSPSAKYDAEGSGGIINIVTKNKNVSGLSGSVSGGIGTRQNNGNANVNYKQNRFSLATNVGGNFAWPQTSIVDFDVTRSDSRTINHSESKTKRHGVIGSATASYDFNDFNSLTSTFRINSGGMNVDGLSTNSFIIGANSIANNSKNTTKGSFSGFDWNADYTKKFKAQGHELTIAGQWSRSNISADYSTIFENAVNVTNFANQMGNNSGVNNEYTIQADYALPISKILKLEAGGKTIFRRINSDYDIFRQVNNQGEFVLDPISSNLYNYNQDVYAGYTVFNFTLPKGFGMQVGARMENTQIEGNPQNSTQVSLQPFTQDYNTFVPSFVLSKQLKDYSTFKLSYNKRIQRPSLQVLNPFINKSNPDNQQQGNPALAPEIAQTIELGYSKFIKTSVINISAYYKHTSNLIESVGETPLDEQLNRRVNRTTFKNVGENNSFGASFFGSVNPIKILTIRGNINAFNYNPTVYTQFDADLKSSGSYIMYNAFLGGSLALKKGISAEMFAVLNSPRRTIQGKNPSFSLYGFGLKKEIWNKKASIGLNALSPFKEYLSFNQDISGSNFTQKSIIKYPIRSFGLTFSYNFGKMNFTQKKKKGVNNDDLLQGGDQGGMGGGTGSGPRQ